MGTKLRAAATTLAVTATLAITALTACGTDDEATPAAPDGVRIASFDFDESILIAELYAQALEGAGLPVVRLGAIGPREVVAPALEQGLIDVVPEYLGTASSHFAADPPDLEGLAAALEPRGITPLEPAPAEDVNVFVVTDTEARMNDLVAISDLAAVDDRFRIGGPVECPERPLCLEGLRTTYGLEFAEFVPQRSLAVTAEALVRDEIDVGVFFSTAPEITSGPFVVLLDDRRLQPAENIVPLVRDDAVQRWGAELGATLDRLSELLTTTDLQTMNRSVGDGEAVEVTAAEWLGTTDIIRP